MSKNRVLTKEIAEQHHNAGEYLDLREFTSIDAAAAQVLAKHKGDVNLSGLTSLSDGVASALGEMEGPLSLNGLANLSPAAAAALARLKNRRGEFNFIQLHSLQLSADLARALAKYRGDQLTFGCTSIELAVLKAFRPFKGQLWLGKVTSLDDKAAAELARRSGEAYLDAVEEYTDSPGHLALARAIVGWNKGAWIGLRGLKRVAPGVREVFAEFDGENIHSSPAVLKEIITAKRERVQAVITSGRLKQPTEWQGGRIVPSKAPAKPLKGRQAERTKAGEASWWLPKKVCDWFVQKLDDTHKTSVSGEGFGSGKSAYISPEAAQLLRAKSVVWMWLVEREAGAAKEREQASLASLAKLPVPKEFRDGKVFLSAPKKPVAEAHCWKPDFAGEDYQSVLYYYGYLSAEHVGSLTDANGYPAKTMSLEAADLYRGQRAFWVAKHAKSKAQAKAAGQVQKEAVKQRVAKAAVSAGLSRAELSEKLNRLGELAKQGDLKLVADMVAGFGDAWLYQALLAGSSISPEGDLKPGKPLKRFKEHAEIILLLAVAFMPEGVDVDQSLRRDAIMQVEVTNENVDILAETVASRLPGLRANKECIDLDELTDLRQATAVFLARQKNLEFSELRKLGVEAAAALSKHEGNLDFSGLKTLDAAVAEALHPHKGSLDLTGLSSVSEAVAKALGQLEGGLTLGLKVLPEPIAAGLATHRGDLKFPELRSISSAAAAALEGHSGKLILGGGSFSSGANFTLDAVGALALSAREHDLELNEVEALPSGLGGVRLCERLARQSSCQLMHLKELDPDCAAALAATRGALVLGVENWTDGALIALAAYQGKLEINPAHISDEVARALAQRNAASSLLFVDPYETILITDAAAEALSGYPGELAFGGDLDMSSQAAAHLVKRRTLGVFKTKLKSAARKVFDAAGRWSGEWIEGNWPVAPMWTRKG